MRLAYFTLMILALIINVTARVLHAKGASHLKAMERLISGKGKEDMRNYLISRGFLEDHAAKRQQGGFSLVLHIISATHGSFDLSVPVSLDDSDTCLKQTSGRGFGTEPSDDTCPDDQEKSGALCYPTCPDDFHGSGPVCWQNCPSSTPQKCGAMCTVSESKCLERVASIVKSALEVGVEVLAGIDPLDAEMLIKAAFEVVDTVEDVMSNPYC